MYTPVLYGLLIYLLYVLVPLIPALIIYKLFPNTKVGLAGPLGNLKMNASGAFAAYLIIVIMGHFIIKQNLSFVEEIKTMENKIEKLKRDLNEKWTISAPIEFYDSHGNKLSDGSNNDVGNILEIEVLPPYISYVRSNLVEFEVFSNKTLPAVSFSFPGFDSHLIELDSFKSTAKEENKILLKAIQFKKNLFEYNEESTASSLPSDSDIEGPPTEK